jgi:hypothetical protein
MGDYLGLESKRQFSSTHPTKKDFAADYTKMIVDF